MSYTPFYGPPGVGSGWEDGTPAENPLATRINKQALDHAEQGIMDAAAAVDELAPGAPGTRVVDVAKLPVGTTAGTVAAGDDSRLAGADPLLANAALFIAETTPGHYTRPATTKRVIFVGTVPALPGGTTAGGTGTAVAVTGLDFQITA